jgi:hypothetical protein
MSTGLGGVAFFKDNQGLLEWVNAQPLAEQFICLGDGHNGVWNIFSEMGTPQQRIEVLDWYHLMENAHKVQGTPAQVSQMRALLWRGETQKAIEYLRQEQCRGATGFINYLRHHQRRIIDYPAWQEAGHSIGSGRVESLVKQIGLRVKLPGALRATGECAEGVEASLCLPEWRISCLIRLSKSTCAE